MSFDATPDLDDLGDRLRGRPGDRSRGPSPPTRSPPRARSPRPRAPTSTACARCRPSAAPARTARRRRSSSTRRRRRSRSRLSAAAGHTDWITGPVAQLLRTCSRGRQLRADPGDHPGRERHAAVHASRTRAGNVSAPAGLGAFNFDNVLPVAGAPMTPSSQAVVPGGAAVRVDARHGRDLGGRRLRGADPDRRPEQRHAPDHDHRPRQRGGERRQLRGEARPRPSARPRCPRTRRSSGGCAPSTTPARAQLEREGPDDRPDGPRGAHDHGRAERADRRTPRRPSPGPATRPTSTGSCRASARRTPVRQGGGENVTQTTLPSLPTATTSSWSPRSPGPARAAPRRRARSRSTPRRPRRR